jgi:hypothetical protein
MTQLTLPVDVVQVKRQLFPKVVYAIFALTAVSFANMCVIRVFFCVLEPNHTSSHAFCSK